MRIILIALFILINCSICFAIDTSLGDVELTNNQVLRLKDLTGSLDGTVKGFSYWPESKGLIVVTDRKLTEGEKIQIVNLVEGLSDDPIPVAKTVDERIAELESKVAKAETDITELKAK